MRKIDASSAFKRDLKRESKGRYRASLSEDLQVILKQLMIDTPLEPKYRDHYLIGDWIGYRECHIKPDLLLIYKATDENTLRLARLGSHSELFG